jgi:hypothetical protein
LILTVNPCRHDFRPSKPCHSRVLSPPPRGTFLGTA